MFRQIPQLCDTMRDKCAPENSAWFWWRCWRRFLYSREPPGRSGCSGGKALEIYFIDVEGGQSTLIVSPSGQSLLIDTGWRGFEGRDADRIVRAADAAHVKQIDYLLIMHDHRDHVGGVPAAR